MKAETVIGPVSLVEKPARSDVGILLKLSLAPCRGDDTLRWSTGGTGSGVAFEPIDPHLKETYVSRYEAYLADGRLETRKLLWDTELSIKIV